MQNNYQPGDIVLNNWTLVRLLGQGSYGTVFEAHREDFGTTYKAAVKIITIPQSQGEIDNARSEGMNEADMTAYFRKFVEEIVREFALMAELKGTANVVSYEDHTVIPHENNIGWDIIIRMELLQSLFEYADENEFTKQDIIKLGMDICRGLELCQKFNIIHRDIKPENIMVSKLGDYKLGDFGIARTVDKTTAALTKRGTYTYMAPEVFNEGVYGPAVDIYSLGIVMYRLLNNNRTPFLPQYPNPITPQDREAALIKRMGGKNTLPAPQNADGRLAEIVLKACAHDMNHRYSAPMQMRQELEAILYTREEAPLIYPQGDDVPVKSVEYIEKDPDATEMPDARVNGLDATEMLPPRPAIAVERKEPPAKVSIGRFAITKIASGFMLTVAVALIIAIFIIAIFMNRESIDEFNPEYIPTAIIVSPTPTPSSIVQQTDTDFTAIYVNNEQIAILNTLEEAEQVKNRFLDLYVNNNTIDAVIEGWEFRPLLEIEEELVTVHQAIERLDKQVEVIIEYIVGEDDTKGNIALRKGIPFNRLLQDNDLTQDSYINPGDLLLIRTAHPFLSIKTIEEITQTIVTPIEVYTRYNNQLISEDINIIQAGSEGLREIILHITYINGQPQSEEIISINIIQEPEMRIVEIGNKTIATDPRNTLTGHWAGTFNSGTRLWGLEMTVHQIGTRFHADILYFNDAHERTDLVAHYTADILFNEETQQFDIIYTHAYVLPAGWSRDVILSGTINGNVFSGDFSTVGTAVLTRTAQGA